MKQILWVMTMMSLLTLVGFDFSKHAIPLNEIYDGGPPKDGIPALYDPEFIPAANANYLSSADRILGLVIKGEAKAYPVRILNWHELVNDRVGGKNVLVSYCPLCGTGMAFEANIKDGRYLFGVSGKLYNSNVLFYDKETESLWSQIKMEAVIGFMTGQKLKLLPLEHTTWQAWRDKHPESLVVSNKTGHFRDYARNPYVGYRHSEDIYFPVNHRDKRLSVKEWVAGIVIDGKAKAYSFARLKKGEAAVKDVFAGKNITIHYDNNNESVAIRDSDGSIIPFVQAYWFAWSAFYPETELYK